MTAKLVSLVNLVLFGNARMTAMAKGNVFPVNATVKQASRASIAQQRDVSEIAMETEFVWTELVHAKRDFLDYSAISLTALKTAMETESAKEMGNVSASQVF